MIESIATRELIVLDDLGVAVRGTWHKRHTDSSGTQSDRIEPKRIGLLFLNGISATRAGHGDSAVYWADSFAERGYPSFRLDLPGCGDSEGDPPTDLLGFINLGGYASIASAKTKELVTRFNLSGVVIIGHCSGAVSAIHAATACSECKGLVLLDPYFHLSHTRQPKMRQQLHVWAMQNRVGGFLSRVYDLLKGIRLSLRGNSPPDNANFPLLRHWKKLASTGLPMLILKAPSRKAPGAKQRIGDFDYLKYLLSQTARRSRVVVELTEGANHSFANRQGRAAVRHHTEDWLDAFFPLPDHKPVSVNMSPSFVRKNDRYNPHQESCLQK